MTCVASVNGFFQRNQPWISFCIIIPMHSVICIYTQFRTFWSSYASARRSQHANATCRNIAESNMYVAPVWPPCCELLRQVARCWLKFENVPIFYVTFVDVAWCCSRLARFVHVAPNNVAICCVWLLESFGRSFINLICSSSRLLFSLCDLYLDYALELALYWPNHTPTTSKKSRAMEFLLKFSTANYTPMAFVRWIEICAAPWFNFALEKTESRGQHCPFKFPIVCTCTR